MCMTEAERFANRWGKDHPQALWAPNMANKSSASRICCPDGLCIEGREWGPWGLFNIVFPACGIERVFRKSKGEPGL